MGIVSNLIQKIKEPFRKKEYYATGYDSLNSYSIEFTEVNEVDLKKIENVVSTFQEADTIDNDEVNLFKKESIRYSLIEDLIKNIEKAIIEDYRETYFEAINENWKFNYFLSYPEMIYKDTLLVSNRVQDVNGNIGDVIYPLLAIRKFNKEYYFWELGDNDSNEQE